jgi:hypothetical protein
VSEGRARTAVAPRETLALRVNGTTLHVETVGEGTPCLCLHGGPGTDSSGLVRTLAPWPRRSACA